MRNGNNTYMDVEAEEYSGRSHLVGFIFQIQFNWADDITGDQLYQAAVMTRIWESRSLISPPWIGRAVFFFLFFFVFFPVDISGIKAIKIKLAETLAINENWILTKPFICHVCFMWSQLHQCDVQFNRLCRWGGVLIFIRHQVDVRSVIQQRSRSETCSCLCLHAVFALEFLPRSSSHGSSL